MLSLKFEPTSNKENRVGMHNLMEELVTDIVADVCREDEQRDEQRYCTIDQCRIDTVCYVLNRIAPRYVSSGRGLAYQSDEIENDFQLRADLVRIVHEGLVRITAVQRNYQGGASAPDEQPGARYHFPSIKGRILDGSSFAPVSGVTVTLLGGDGPVGMFDTRWQNPFVIPDQRPGTFLFWPEPIEAGAVGESNSFGFELIATDAAFEDFHHIFSVELTSSIVHESAVTLTHDVNLGDLYMLPR